MTRRVVLLADDAATRAAGAALAPMLRVGDAITLRGSLGAGKTTFARGLIGALGYAHEVVSPSFAIVQAYDPPELRLPLLHVDLYRLNDAAELGELGLDEARRDGALVVEWPERAGDTAFPEALRLLVEIDGAERRLVADLAAGWVDRWPLR